MCSVRFDASLVQFAGAGRCEDPDYDVAVFLNFVDCWTEAGWIFVIAAGILNETGVDINAMPYPVGSCRCA
jgi:hypothetical protein